MANVDAPFGFKPLRYRSGAPYNGACNMYYIPSTDATACFLGDAMVWATTNLKSPENVPMVVQAAAAGENVVGVVVGFLPDTSADTVHRAASTGRYVMLADDMANLVFEVQNSGNFSATQVTLWGDIVVGTGSAITGLSAMELNTSSLVSTAATVRVLRASSKESNVVGTSTNDTNGLNSIVEVMFNEHAYTHL